ncbi:LOW QUALITY PROTEIN: protein lin-37 homolog [Colius striatus]|uniref:LOW QUALITY PROTEIN: protein lin-37 homolog n=1 Tax=Colius striatus TaxID=57412 RepID=UPI002B1E244D|nr:LOW QUALITY PROTEIN: protein lin-37 homolog [Colius striatus]
MAAARPKPEKPELEAAAARSRLDALLRQLSHARGGQVGTPRKWAVLGRREAPEEETAKAAADGGSKELSPSAPGKRPCGRLSQQRRKKRRETDDGAESGAQRHSTYVIKLFDRSVELGQFPEGTPLYPVCRQWVRNCPTRCPTAGPTAGPTPGPPPSHRYRADAWGVLVGLVVGLGLILGLVMGCPRDPVAGTCCSCPP